MRRVKNDDERRVRISITISPSLNDIIERLSDNRSNYIELILCEYFKKNSIDVSKIKI
jgi:hypothetical protein